MKDGKKIWNSKHEKLKNNLEFQVPLRGGAQLFWKSLLDTAELGTERLFMRHQIAHLSSL